MSGGPVVSYTTSAAASVTGEQNIWFVIDPQGVAGSNGTQPPGGSSPTLKIYVQENRPTQADTPWMTEAVSGTSFDGIGSAYRGAADVYWSELVWTLEDYWTFRPADTGFRNSPTKHATGANVNPSDNLNSKQIGVPYLGTDSVGETGEVT
jgi:hypothetical protein